MSSESSSTVTKECCEEQITTSEVEVAVALWFKREMYIMVTPR